MGEAKKRGTFDERKAQAMARNEAEAKRRLEEWQKEQAAMTVEQRLERQKAGMLMAALAPLAGNFRRRRV